MSERDQLEKAIASLEAKRAVLGEAVIVVLLYIGLMKQIIPGEEGISTTGHLFGFLGGIIAAAGLTFLQVC